MRPRKLARLRTRLAVTCHLLLREAPEQAVALHSEQGQAQQTLPHTRSDSSVLSTASKVGRHQRRPRAPPLQQSPRPSNSGSQVARAGSQHRGAPHAPTQARAPSAAHGQEGRQLGLPCPHPSAVLTNSTCVTSDVSQQLGSTCSRGQIL